MQINLDGAEPPSEGKENPIIARAEDATTKPLEKSDPFSLSEANKAEEPEAMITEKEGDAEGPGLRMSASKEKVSPPEANIVLVTSTEFCPHPLHCFYPLSADLCPSRWIHHHLYASPAMHHQHKEACGCIRS